VRCEVEDIGPSRRLHNQFRDCRDPLTIYGTEAVRFPGYRLRNYVAYDSVRLVLNCLRILDVDQSIEIGAGLLRRPNVERMRNSASMLRCVRAEVDIVECLGRCFGKPSSLSVGFPLKIPSVSRGAS